MAEIREKLKYYEDAEEKGLIFCLPCKLGDISYWICDEDRYGNKKLTIRENEPITGITIKGDGVYISTNNYELGIVSRIGSRWALLTREDAERKIKEMEES